ncbi:MAG: hypothetical protein KJO26_07120, partial [Deltaproteobacteria bacterium]|nr:hypothetical protein [Deltaproteobacteria bacterium]
MAAIISLQNIQQVVSNLPYPSAKSLKSRLAQAIMRYYNDADTVRTLQIIPAEALIQALWQTGNDAVLIRKKQKNLSSVRSSVNIDLKKLASKGKNPDGLQVSNANIFVMSDEAKDKALDEFLDKLPGDKPTSLDEITKILQMVGGVLSNLEANESNESTDRQDFVTELKSVIDGLNSKISSDAFGNDNEECKSDLASDLDDLPIQKEDIEDNDELEELEFLDDADLSYSEGDGSSADTGKDADDGETVAT